MAWNMKVPPKLEDGTAYEGWKKDLSIWCDLTDLSVEKRALAVHLSLTGRARAASSEIEISELKKMEGVDTIIAKLDNLFLADKGRRQFAAFHTLYNFRRSRDSDVSNFVTEFEHIYFKFTQQDMTLPDTVMAFMLLAACNLSENEGQLVMSAISDVSYPNMKSALKRIFSADIAPKSNIAAANVPVKSEPVFYGNETDDSQVFYTRGGKRGKHFWRDGPPSGRAGVWKCPVPSCGNNNLAWRNSCNRCNEAKPPGLCGDGKGGFRGRGSRGRGDTPLTGANLQQPARSGRKMNPLGPDGKVSRCLICESKFHWARECPDAYERIEKSGTEDGSYEIIHLALFVGYTTGERNSKLQTLIAESKGYAVLDTGCSTTVCGLKWYEEYLKDLSEFDRSKVIEEDSLSTFAFGDGVAVQSSKKVTLPCYLAGLRSTITTDVVDCQIPLLLSKRSMKNAKMCLDFSNDTVKFGGKIVGLGSSTSGHYLLPMTL